MLETSEKFLCAECGGAGLIRGVRCPACGGLAQGVFKNGEFWYWGRSINRSAILFSRFQTAANFLTDILALLAAIAGLLALFARVYDKDFGTVFSLDFWRAPNQLLLAFWLGVWFGAYFLYRVAMAKEGQARIFKKYQKSKEFEPAPTDWGGIVSLPKNKKIDVSKFFNREAVRAIQDGYILADELKHEQVLLIHLFAALLSASKIKVLFGRLGVDQDGLRQRVANALKDAPPRKNITFLSQELVWRLLAAYEEAIISRADFTSPSELLIALAEEDGRVQEILYDLAIDATKIKNVTQWLRVNEILRERIKRGRALARLRPKGEAGRAMTAVATPFLDRVSEDLTLVARAGGLPPIVGREKEIEELFRVLEGGRASVILVGERGVGKDALIEGLAERMVEEDVPKILSDKRLVVLDIPKLISGATAAEAAERLQRIFFEVSRAKNIVFVAPNIEGLVGVTAGGGESIDLADIFGRELAKNYFLTIATTNPAQYSRLVESTSLGNILQKIEIKEVDDNEAIQILEAKAAGIEYQNRVFFSYDALERAVKLSRRYMHERYLPEKAIEIMRETAHDARGRKGENAIVLGEDVAKIISSKTQVPLTEVTAAEGEKLLGLEERMRERVVGQSEAVKAVAAAIRRARVELREAKRPIANFLFLGPTGVGKTELAKTVAEVYFGSENAMIRLDMSEYQDSASLARLIGASGGASGGILTEAVRKQPFILLLLDEIEKADANILNIFLQVMDDGRLTDNSGRVIDFTNVILIATSNAASQFIQEEIRKNTPVAEIKEALLLRELKPYFRPEFLNRFDGVIVFTPLSKTEIEQITWLMIDKIQKQLETKGIVLHVTDEAARELAEAGFDPVFGARPLRRVIQERVQDALANFLLQKKIGRRDVVVLETGGVIRIEKAQEL